MAPVQHPSQHGQTLLHPVVTLPTPPPLLPHQQRLQQQKQKQQMQQQRRQDRPVSPSSFEDSQLENGLEAHSIHSTDLVDCGVGVEAVDHSEHHLDTVDAVDPVHMFDHGHGRVFAGNGAAALLGRVIRNPVAIHTGPEALRNCSNNVGSSVLPTDVSVHMQLGRTQSSLVPGFMMATPPLSPTRQQFIKELMEVDRPEPIANMPTHTLRPEPMRTPPPPTRARAGSAPPSTQGSRSGWAASSAGPPMAGMLPVIPPPQLAGQLPSAWSALLPGVAPIRVNPRPVRPPSRPMPSILSTEQRLHQQVPIVLAPECEARLTMEMYSLFETLLPTEESHQRRTRLISKIERIIRTEWPGQDIKVLPFGSTVNDLGTNTSDVDICILTSWLGLQGVEMLAEIFRKHGMENVFCVPEAKVPIVKLWDPELQLSCDMNINTQLGIMNSRMVKTYVAIDHRVRPFAMIIKHWARKRVLNDAANGGTISTYTWICMVINFLQMRSPPILPSLHDMSHELSPDNQVINGNNTSFFSDLSRLEGFGRDNKESLGGLLYAFFRKFAIEFDYDHHVVSVRHGCYLTKESKGWHHSGKHYRLLCVEEPFDTTRNLGNSCDMTSSKGLKQEFRRALDILNHSGNLDQVCEQWVFPPCYYHNNSSTYHRGGNHNGFLNNKNAAAGKRYGNGSTRSHYGYNSHTAKEMEAEESGKYRDSSRHPRSTNLSQQSENRYGRSGYDKRPRSSSMSHLKDTASSSLTSRISNTGKSMGSVRQGRIMGSITEEAAARNKASANKVVTTNTTSQQIGVQAQDRVRKSSVSAEHEHDGALEKQAEKAVCNKTSSAITGSPTRSKSAGRNSGGDVVKGQSGQKNGRIGAGPNREGGQGGKAPRAAVELCLADIAKIVNKSDMAQSTLETTGDGDAGDCRRKKGGKKSVLWSTNSNRGDSRGSHHGFKQQDNVMTENSKARPFVTPTAIDEAGLRTHTAVSK